MALHEKSINNCYIIIITVKNLSHDQQSKNIHSWVYKKKKQHLPTVYVQKLSAV